MPVLLKTRSCTDERKHLDLFHRQKLLDDDATTFIFPPVASDTLCNYIAKFLLPFPPPFSFFFFFFFFLQTQNHTSNYPGWHSTTIADSTRTSGDSAPVSCLGEHHHCTPSPPVDHGCLPEESASPARCMIVHQSNILDNFKNLLEFAEALQFIDSVSRLAASSGFVRGQGVRGEELGLS